MTEYASVDPAKVMTEAERFAVIAANFKAHFEAESKVALVPKINHNRE